MWDDCNSVRSSWRGHVHQISPSAFTIAHFRGRYTEMGMSGPTCLLGLPDRVFVSPQNSVTNLGNLEFPNPTPLQYPLLLFMNT